MSVPRSPSPVPRAPTPPAAADSCPYYKPWKDAQNSLVDIQEDARGENAWGLTYEGYKPKASGDKALTAFAQLAALRLDVRRSMVSLIDSTQQYILTEATRTLSLLSERRYTPGDEVWLGNTIIKRNDAVCPHSFKSRYTATDDDGRTYTTEALVVPDMREDERFRDREYVVRKPGVLFYAGVPIKTKAGHRIGVYAVSNETPRFGLSVDELIFMEDVAATIMEHLELAKDRDAMMNGSRMVRGLADFIEGIPAGGDEEPEAVLASASAVPISTSLEDQKASPVISAVMRRQTQNAKKMLEDLDEITASGLKDDRPAEPCSPREPQTKPSDKSSSSDDDPNRILQRATHIIRKSTNADGVIFFNTSSRAFQGLGRQAAGAGADHCDASSGITSGSDSTTRRPRNRRTDSGGSPEPEPEPQDGRRRCCEVMGLSVSQHEQYGRLEGRDFRFPEEGMGRYLRSFPHGKFFSFTDTGSGVSSGDELSAEDRPRPPGAAAETGTADGSSSSKRERFIPSELLKVLPGIRSLIFLPLWDFTEGRYVAGGFIWTSTAGRLMNPDNELPYLKAFGNSIMSEISRARAQKSDLAKTTFIASISHELRSPLHGILGSVEFLHETAVSGYQAGLFTSIETCGRTLLDTIDHVLDYAKINKLRRGGGSSTSARKRSNNHHRTSSSRPSHHRRETVGSIVGLTAEFDLAALVEEVVDAVAAGHAFRRTDHGGLISSMCSTASPSSSSSSPSPSSSSTAAMDPVVILDIKPRPSWLVRTQPGALRRIVMNLLGNALKYTPAGFVGVSLSAEGEGEGEGEGQADARVVVVRLRFADSGKGMSPEFQRTRLFSPFSQEDPFASGTGLGLSIVRQIVDALGGSISVSSAQGRGTEVDVVLTLPVPVPVPVVGDINNNNNNNSSSSSSSSNNKPPHAEPFDTAFARGARMCIVDPAGLAAEAGVELREPAHRALAHLEDTLRSSAEEWFGMEVETRGDSHSDTKCDYTLFPLPPASPDTLLRWHGSGSGASSSPRPTNVIVLCSNTAQAAGFRAAVAAAAPLLLRRGIHAVPVTQPLGPRKLAGVMHKLAAGEAAGDLGLAPGRRQQNQDQQRVVIGRQDSDPEAIRRERDMLREAQRAEGETTAAVVRPGPGVLVGRAEAGQEEKRQQQRQTQNMALPRGRAGSASRSVSAPPDRIQPQEDDGAGAGAGPGAGPPHVLLVDDNDINLQLLVMFMRKQGLSYDTAGNGQEALDKYERAAAAASPHNSRRRPFTHILMDLSMPVMDGLTATRRIRAAEAGRAAAAGPATATTATIIALTGLASAEAQDDALAAGINKFLVKPVKFGELRGLLRGGC